MMKWVNQRPLFKVSLVQWILTVSRKGAGYFPILGTELRSGTTYLNLAGSPALAAKLPAVYSPGRAVRPSHGSHGTGGTQAGSPSRWKDVRGQWEEGRGRVRQSQIPIHCHFQAVQPMENTSSLWFCFFRIAYRWCQVWPKKKKKKKIKTPGGFKIEWCNVENWLQRRR